MEDFQTKKKQIQFVIRERLERYKQHQKELHSKSEVKKSIMLGRNVELTFSENNDFLSDRFSRIVLHRKVIDWRDKHITQIELHLMRQLPLLMTRIDRELEQLSTYDSTSGMKKVNQKIIQPLFNRWVEQQHGVLLKNAQAELQTIHDTVLLQLGVCSDIDTLINQTHVRDSFVGAAFGVSGIALIPVVSSASIVSAGGVLGLVGVTTLSFPIAAVGGLAVLSLFVLGGNKVSSIKRNAQLKYRQDIGQKIDEFVFSKGNQNTKGLSFSLQSHITAASNNILKGLTK